MTTLHDALTARFDDIDEIKDVANYGCSAGVSGFIYSTELAKFYDNYEDDIEDELDNIGLKLHDLVDTDEFYTMQELKEKSVWCVVELWCQAQLDAHELEQEALAA
jgi:hypothetical protein